MSFIRDSSSSPLKKEAQASGFRVRVWGFGVWGLGFGV